MESDRQETAVAQALIDRHFDIWNDDDRAARLARFPAIYAPEFFVADYAAKAVGHEAVNELIARVRREHPGDVFSPAPVEWNHGVGRVRWGFGPADRPPLVRGEDIFTVDGGKIASLYVFIDSQ